MTIEDVLANRQAWHIEAADVLDGLALLPAGSVHTVVTSPPYWALRKYGAGPKELGSETTSAEYLAHQVAVFREVRRVLRGDGVCWVNIGDSMTFEPGNGRGGGSTLAGGKPHLSGGPRNGAIGRSLSNTGARMCPGNLAAIPYRLGLALQADCWTWRSTVVWAKPSPMPESLAGWRWEQHQVKVRGNLRGVGSGKMDAPDATQLTQGFNARWDAAHEERPNSDRAGKDFVPSAIWEPCPGCRQCAPNDGLVLRRGSWRATRSHEYILMLTKGMQYFSDGEAVKEVGMGFGPRDRRGNKYGPDAADRLVAHEGLRKGGLTRNPRDVQRWSPEPQGTPQYAETPEGILHYAAFPPALPDWCLRATCPTKVCAACNAPWAPVVETALHPRGDAFGRKEVGDHDHGQAGSSYKETSSKVLGYRQTCGCLKGLLPIPGLAIDPYCGTGTTMLAAVRLGLRAIGIELREEYAALARARITSDAPLFNRVAP